MSAHVGEPEIPALVAVGEPLVVEAKTVKDRRLEVGHVHLVTGDVEAELVGLAVVTPPRMPPPASHIVKALG